MYVRLMRNFRDTVRNITTLHFARRWGLAMLHATDLLDRATLEIPRGKAVNQSRHRLGVLSAYCIYFQIAPHLCSPDACIAQSASQLGGHTFSGAYEMATIENPSGTNFLSSTRTGRANAERVLDADSEHPPHALASSEF